MLMFLDFTMHPKLCRALLPNIPALCCENEPEVALFLHAGVVTPSAAVVLLSYRPNRSHAPKVESHKQAHLCDDHLV